MIDFLQKKIVNIALFTTTVPPINIMHVTSQRSLSSCIYPSTDSTKKVVILTFFYTYLL